MTSSSINSEGNFLTVVGFYSAKPNGENQSPQLSWDAVEGAKSYAIYMYDQAAGDWIHWKFIDVTKTSLEQGESTSDYKGPYPPVSHEYEIVVYALKDKADVYDGTLDAPCVRSDVQNALDISNGEPGNILAVGSVKAYFYYDKEIK